MIPINEFKSEVQHWAARVGVSPKEVHMRKMRRKWASCSARGRLTFNYDLLREDLPTRNKVVLHELLHLRYPNHGKMFHSLLEAYTAEAAGVTSSRRIQ